MESKAGFFSWLNGKRYFGVKFDVFCILASCQCQDGMSCEDFRKIIENLMDDLSLNLYIFIHEVKPCKSMNNCRKPRGFSKRPATNSGPATIESEPFRIHISIQTIHHDWSTIIKGLLTNGFPLIRPY